MRYYSTNRQVEDVTLAEALLQGQAADHGLFLPRQFPRLGGAELRALAGRSYPEIAHAVLRGYTAGAFDDDELLALCVDAYDYEVPLEHVTDRQHVMRLDQGPTASFKDFAARLMAGWISRLVERGDGELVILVATSGDTGSAVAHAFHGVPRVSVVVLFPVDEVSDRQRRQMTTLGGNVLTIGIEGKFDDGQAMVKRAFADPELRSLRLSSANSINIGRLLPQAVYYVYAYLRLAGSLGDEPIVLSVPSGNFGDAMGGVIASRMGLPVRRFVIATNENDEFPRFLRTGRYEPIVPLRVCISNAMNVGHPSNLARLVDLYGGWMDEKGVLREAPDLERLRRDVHAVSIDEVQTRRTIREAYDAYGLVLEPHGAVGWAGLQAYLRQAREPAGTLCVALETAHPAKFPEEVQAITGVTPATPPSLDGIDDRPEHYPVIAAEYGPFRDLLRERFGAAGA